MEKSRDHANETTDHAQRIDRRWMELVPGI